MAETLIIAEAGVNHCGRLDLAMELVDAAKKAGADIVKFQTFKADNLAAPSAKQAAYQTRNMGKVKSQYEMLKALELSYDDFHHLFDYCQKQEIEFLSTPFDLDSLNFLVNDLGVARLKIGSGDMTTAPLLYAIAQTGLPVIMSTGMAVMAEVELAMAVLQAGYANEIPNYEKLKGRIPSLGGDKVLQEKVSLLHCTTEYPAPLETINLFAMDALAERFGCVTGFSDHSEGGLAPVLAVGRGAKIIEKHVTLSHDLPGPDHKASLLPTEFEAMVTQIRQTEIILGKKDKEPSVVELENRNIARKSITAVCDITHEETLTEYNMTFKRPGTGISPFHYWDVLGQKVRETIEKDQTITYDLLGEVDFSRLDKSSVHDK